MQEKTCGKSLAYIRSFPYRQFTIHSYIHVTNIYLIYTCHTYAYYNIHHNNVLVLQIWPKRNKLSNEERNLFTFNT